MATAETIMVAATLERLTPGTELKKLAPHITYVSWFRLPIEYRAAFDAMMEEIVEINRPPRPVGGELLRYGNEERGFQEVRKIDQMTRGFNDIIDFWPHAALYSFARRVDPGLDGQYFGVQWHPHTFPEVGEGEELIINNLTEFKKDKEQGVKIVNAVYPWERKYETTS